MGKCLIAQSGGPTAVINATLAGIVKANQENPVYDAVWGGLHGIEGILQEHFVDLTNMGEEENLILRQTPSSALGACRYKLRRSDPDAFKEVFRILDKYEIDTLFYIGGNDSMDTVAALAAYAAKHGISNHRFIGCPKTVDNDLVVTDLCPGFGSAAKYIATTAQQTWLDLNVYPNSRKEIFILETMGRDAGWLAASSCLSGIVDILIVPEVPFDREDFLNRVKVIMEQKSKCYIVVSEGARYSDGTYVSAGETRIDAFGTVVLGGAANALQQMILEAGVSQRCRVMDLSSAQRSAASEQSLFDVEASYNIGVHAHELSRDPSFTGRMIAVKRYDDEDKPMEFFGIEAEKVSNIVRNFPLEWLREDYAGVTGEAIAYMRPLIQGTPDIIIIDGLPAYVLPYYLQF